MATIRSVAEMPQNCERIVRVLRPDVVFGHERNIRSRRESTALIRVHPSYFGQQVDTDVAALGQHLTPR